MDLMISSQPADLEGICLAFLIAFFTLIGKNFIEELLLSFILKVFMTFGQDRDWFMKVFYVFLGKCIHLIFGWVDPSVL